MNEECSLLYRRGMTGPTQTCGAQPQECPGTCCKNRNTFNCPPPRKPKDASSQSTPRQSTDQGNLKPLDPDAIEPVFRGASSLKEPLASLDHADKNAILCEMERMMKSICNCKNDLPDRLKITSLPPGCSSVEYKKESLGSYTISQTGEQPIPVVPPPTPADDQSTCAATSCNIAKEISEIEENLKLLRRELLRTRKEQEWLREQKRLLDCVKPKPCKPCPANKQICVPPVYASPRVVACVNTVKPTWTLPNCEGKRL